MSQPIEICIEDLDAPAGAPRYVRCVALPGRQPGLAVGEKGELLWKSPGPAACELWVSADARLILYRPEGASSVVVRRAGRTLEAPAEKPVVLLHEDFIQAGGKRMRVHVHGIAHTVAPPTPIASFARAAVAAAIGGSVLLGAAPGGGHRRLPDAGVAADAGVQPIEVFTAEEKAWLDAVADDAGVQPPIEVRLRPPEVDLGSDELRQQEESQKKTLRGPQGNADILAPPVRMDLELGDVMAVLLANKAGINKCVAEGKAKDPTVTGPLVMRWTILKNGKTSNITVETERLRGSHIALCLSKLVSTFQFPPHQKQGEPVEFPFSW